MVRLAALALAVLVPCVAGAAERTVTLAVDNMYCSACPYIVRETLAGVQGVSGVVVSLEEKRATVTYDDALTGPEALVAASTAAGYPARPVP